MRAVKKKSCQALSNTLETSKDASCLLLTSLGHYQTKFVFYGLLILAGQYVSHLEEKLIRKVKKSLLLIDSWRENCSLLFQTFYQKEEVCLWDGNSFLGFWFLQELHLILTSLLEIFISSDCLKIICKGLAIDSLS